MERQVFIAFFHDVVESNLVDLQTFRSRDDAEKYVMTLGKKWFNKDFGSLTEMEIWLRDPEQSADAPGYMDIIESVLN